MNFKQRAPLAPAQGNGIKAIKDLSDEKTTSLTAASLSPAAQPLMAQLPSPVFLSLGCTQESKCKRPSLTFFQASAGDLELHTV